jgi:segregation and condensation protein A
MARYEVALIDSVHIIPTPLSVEEKMAWVLKKLEKTGDQTFRDLAGPCRSRIEMITVFLSLLELFKQGVVLLCQPETFGDIKISLSGGRA